MDERNAVVDVELPNGQIVSFEATGSRSGPILEAAFSFTDVAATIESMADTLAASLRKIKPDKASVEFGVQVQAEAGKLTALIVKGSASANLKVTLQWEMGEKDG